MKTLTTAHFEHATPLLGEIDIMTMLEAQERLASGDTASLQAFLESIVKSAKARAFRRLAAVLLADVEELLEVELDPDKMKALELRAARLPFAQAFAEVVGFFPALLPAPGFIPDSSETPKEASGATNAPPSDDSPSGDS